MIEQVLRVKQVVSRNELRVVRNHLLGFMLAFGGLPVSQQRLPQRGLDVGSSGRSLQRLAEYLHRIVGPVIQQRDSAV